MQGRRLLGVGGDRRSSVEPGTGLLAGAGADVLTVTVPGPGGAVLSLGERGFVAALIALARDRGAELGSLERVSTGAGRVPVARLGALHRQTAELLDAVGGESGWALYATSAEKPVVYTRSLLPTIPPTILLATPTAAVAVGEEGLRLRLRGLTLTGWHPDGERIVLHTTTGTQTLRSSTLSAVLLRHLAAGRTDAVLVRRPVTDLADPLLAGLRVATMLAAERGVPLLLRHRPPTSDVEAAGGEATAAPAEHGLDRRAAATSTRGVATAAVTATQSWADTRQQWRERS